MSDRITSVHNQRIKDAAKLRSRDGREAQQRIIVDGAREIARALDAGVEVLDLFVCEETLREDAQQLVQRAQCEGVPVCFVSPAVQDKLCFGQRDEGLVAIARPPHRTLSQLRLPDEALVAVLAGVEKPGNIGAVMRSADSAGLSAVIVADGGTDLFNPNAIRASLGTVFSLPLLATSSSATLDWLGKHQFRVFAARVNSSQLYTDVDLTGRTTLVLGNEATGLSDAWRGDGITPISLPLLGVADSLNVSVTAGVLFYEALRQRRCKHGNV